MNPRSSRLLLTLGLAFITWLLLARFVWLTSEGAPRRGALPYGGVAFVSYLLTIGYAVYYRTYWAKPREVTGREWAPVWRWALTIIGIAVFGVTFWVLFPNFTQSFAGLLFVQTVMFGAVGVGLVATVSKPPTPTAERAQAPTFARTAARVSLWHVYALVGAVLLFWPIYAVMKAIETHVDIPACERTCEAHGYTYESLATGKSVYNCNCRGADGRHTYHDRAHIGGGTGAASAFFDWVLRTGAALGTVGVWLVLVFGTPYWIGARGSNTVVARAYRACSQFFGTSEQRPSTANAPRRKVKRRRRARR